MKKFRPGDVHDDDEMIGRLRMHILNPRMECGVNYFAHHERDEIRQDISRYADAVLAWFRQEGRHRMYSRAGTPMGMTSDYERSAKSFVITYLGLGFFARLFFPYIAKLVIRLLLDYLHHPQHSKVFRDFVSEES